MARTTTTRLSKLPSATAASYNILWEENFDTPFDPNMWTPELGYPRNQEIQQYTDNSPENVFTRDGKMILRATARDSSIDYTMDSWINRGKQDNASVVSACVTTLDIGAHSTDRKIGLLSGLWEVTVIEVKVGHSVVRLIY